MHVCGISGPAGAPGSALQADLQRLAHELARALGRQGLHVSLLTLRFGSSLPPASEPPPGLTGLFETLEVTPHGLRKERRFDVEIGPQVHALLPELAPCDWALVLNCPAVDLPRLEWVQPGVAAVYPDDPFVAALVVPDPSAPLPEPTLRPVFAAADVESLAAWLLAEAARFAYTRELPDA